MFRSLYYLFTPYVNPSERRIGRFFASVKEHGESTQLTRKLTGLIQADVGGINLWTESRYKGYNYLTKQVRRELYGNLEAIKEDFSAFATSEQVDVEEIVAYIKTLGVDTMKLRTFPEQLRHLALIMRYLSPERGKYIYRDSSSFGRLLKDPTSAVLEGDCNQIVTLYIYLYATAFNVDDLKLTLLPEHVALHFQGVDIEATTARFVNYAAEKRRIVPIEEIVSINLLDTTDINFTKSLVDPTIFLQAARLGYQLSSERHVVEHNLDAAYHNVVQRLLSKQRFKDALTYALQSKDYELIEQAATNGAIHETQAQHFRSARIFAERSSQKAKLIRQIDEHEAHHEYRNKHYQEALRRYERLGMKDAARQCYKALYIEAQHELRSVHTIEELKAHSRTIHKMQQYARSSGDAALIEHARGLAKQI